MGTMKSDGNKPKRLLRWISGVPLVAAAGASLLPLQRFGQQFMVLAVLVWIQIFFVVEFLLMN
jgi:hypothetical protein